MTTLTLSQANSIVAAAFAKGTELKLKPLSVAVLDAGGHLIAFQRADGASTLRPQIAAGKASGALALGVSSRKIAEMAAERPTFIELEDHITRARTDHTAAGARPAPDRARLLAAIWRI